MQRGVIHVPDFVANAGALIHWGTLVVERGSLADAEARVRRIGETTRGILDRARAEGRTPWAIACSMI
jgi:glutamate dehydrogenase/leucine dehydrogenase